MGYGIQDHGIQDHIRTTADRRRGGLREAEEPIRRRRVSLGSGDIINIKLDRPALTQVRDSRRFILRSHRERVEPIIDKLADMRFLDIVPDRMRTPAFPGRTVLGDSGGESADGLAGDLRRSGAKENSGRMDAGTDTDGCGGASSFPIDRYGDRIRLFILERRIRRIEISSRSASDGTLTLPDAKLAALLDEEPTRSLLYFFEEIDNGIHPARLWHLAGRLIERQTAKGAVLRSITTTHSPDMLNFAW